MKKLLYLTILLISFSGVSQNATLAKLDKDFKTLTKGPKKVFSKLKVSALRVFNKNASWEKRFGMKKNNVNDLAYYVEVFIRDARVNHGIKIKVDDVSITFKDLEARLLGLSFDLGGNDVKIQIDPDRWKTLNRASKMWLIYHEMAHSVLGLDHNEDIFILNQSHERLGEFYNFEAFEYHKNNLFNYYKYKNR